MFGQTLEFPQLLDIRMVLVKPEWQNIDFVQLSNIVNGVIVGEFKRPDTEELQYSNAVQFYIVLPKRIHLW